MQQRIASRVSVQRRPAVSALELAHGEEGAWLVCAHSIPTGRRFLITVAGAADGDSALDQAKHYAAQLDPFTGPESWEFSVEFYDVDAVIAMQCDDTVLDEPIPYSTTPQLAPQDLELEEFVLPPIDEDLFWPERAAELRRK
jgi:hypothetical protein